MKRKITVEIDIDTERNGHSMLLGQSENQYVISIRKDIDMFGNEPHAAEFVLSHELGHLIGHVFNLPAASEEPRSIFDDIELNYNQKEIQDKILASENEASNLGELLLAASRMRKISIGTYLSMLNLPKDNSK
jgi:hypothetical protein